MPKLVAQLSERFRDAIQSAFPEAGQVDPAVNVSQQEEFGDYQSNAAMALAKKVGQKPRQVAEKIKAALKLGEMASDNDITIAGPGFINVKLDHVWLAKRLQELRIDSRLGLENVPNPQIVVVDYSGPNVAKEMHVGHLRSTIIGDAISRVLEAQGHKIVRQNHIGDWGTQFGMLIEHLFDTFGRDKVLSANFAIGDLNVFYQEAKVKFDAEPDFANRARQRVVHLQANDPDTYESWRLLYVESLEHFDTTYDRLDVKLDDEAIRGESAYNAVLPSIVADLQKSGLAIESDGATAVFIDGPDKPPMIVKKSDGGYLYATTDLAAIRYRVSELHANRIIYVHDSRQAHHFAQLFATVRKAGWDKLLSPTTSSPFPSPGTPGEGRGGGLTASQQNPHPSPPPEYRERGQEGQAGVSSQPVQLDFAPFGTMLGEDNKPFKTRSGGTVKLADLLDEAESRALKVVESKNPELPDDQKKAISHAVGIGAVKYSDLAKDRVADYVFSFDKMLSLDGNTAPYLQYAHARIKSIFRKAALSGGDSEAGEINLQSPYEITLAKHILRLGDCIEMVARDLKPHLLCTYLYDLATKFSGFYENCPVLQVEHQATRPSRLALCDLTARTFETALDLLGIAHPDKM